MRMHTILSVGCLAPSSSQECRLIIIILLHVIVIDIIVPMIFAWIIVLIVHDDVLRAAALSSCNQK